MAGSWYTLGEGAGLNYDMTSGPTAEKATPSYQELYAATGIGGKSPLNVDSNGLAISYNPTQRTVDAPITANNSGSSGGGRSLSAGGGGGNIQQGWGLGSSSQPQVVGQTSTSSWTPTMAMPTLTYAKTDPNIMRKTFQGQFAPQVGLAREALSRALNTSRGLGAGSGNLAIRGSATRDALEGFGSGIGLAQSKASTTAQQLENQRVNEENQQRVAAYNGLLQQYMKTGKTTNTSSSQFGNPSTLAATQAGPVTDMFGFKRQFGSV